MENPSTKLEKVLVPFAPEITGAGTEDEKIHVGVQGGVLNFKRREVPMDLFENFSEYEIVEKDLGPADDGSVARKVSYFFRRKIKS